MENNEKIKKLKDISNSLADVEFSYTPGSRERESLYYVRLQLNDTINHINLWNEPKKD